MLRPFYSDEDEQRFIDNVFSLYFDAYLVRAACEAKYGKFLKFAEYQDIEDIKLDKHQLNSLKRSDTLLELAFAKHFLNYGDWNEENRNETI